MYLTKRLFDLLRDDDRDNLGVSTIMFLNPLYYLLDILIRKHYLLFSSSFVQWIDNGNELNIYLSINNFPLYNDFRDLIHL